MEIHTATKSKQHQPSRLRRKIAAVAVTLMALAAPIATATPAQAATSTSFCFKWSTGAAYKNQPVYLYAWQNGRWTNIRSGRTNSNGCGVFTNVPSSVHTTVQAYKALGDVNVGFALWEGWAPNYANPGTGGANLGTGIVSLVHCTNGLHDYCAGF